jgi:hypothetical protein
LVRGCAAPLTDLRRAVDPADPRLVGHRPSALPLWMHLVFERWLMASVIVLLSR